jgi:hypothetical protein
MFSRDTYEKRRLALKQEFENGVIVIPGNTLLPMNYEEILLLLFRIQHSYIILELIKKIYLE